MKDADTDGLFGHSNETSEIFDAPDLQHGSQDAVSDHRSFMQPKPKAVSAKPGPQSACSLAIKRISDELASRHVHSTVLQMKQPWQKGPLAGRDFLQAEALFGASAGCQLCTGSGALRPCGGKFIQQ